MNSASSNGLNKSNIKMDDINDCSVYKLISLLSLNLAGKIQGDREEISKLAKTLRIRGHEILLSKYKNTTPSTPDWDGEDCLSIILWQVFQREKDCKSWSSEKHKHLCSLLDKVETVMKQNPKDSTTAEILRMFISININYIRNHKSTYVWEEERTFFPKYDDLVKKQEGIMKSYKMKDTDFVYNWAPPPVKLNSRFQMKKSVSWCVGGPADLEPREESKVRQTLSSHTLDEGFVTPNDDPGEAVFLTPIAERKPSNEWLWDVNILCGKLRKKLLTWESIGKVSKPEQCFITDNWRQAYKYLYSSKGIKEIPTKQLCLDITSLLLGSPSTSFLQEGDCFKKAPGICVEGIPSELLNEICEPFIECAHRFQILKKLSRETPQEVVSQALRTSLRAYLYKYEELVLRMPQCKRIMSIKQYMRPLMDQMGILNSVLFQDDLPCPSGYVLLDRLYLALSLYTEPYILHLLASFFFSCCQAYYHLLDKWVWEGEVHPDLFVNEDLEKLNLKDRFSWVFGYIASNDRLPSFLLPVGKQIFMCGKVINLLKVCNPQDPLILRLQLKDRPKMLLMVNEEKLLAFQNECLTFSNELVLFLPPRYSELPVKDYYVNRATDVPAFIKEKKEERKLEANRKTLELEEQKKEIEEVRERKKEEKRISYEEDMKILKEFEKEEALRIEREKEIRKQLMDRYKQSSAEADKKKMISEWRVRRMELDEKRTIFLHSEWTLDEKKTTEKLDEAEKKLTKATLEEVEEVLHGEKQDVQNEKNGNVELITEKHLKEVEEIDEKPAHKYKELVDHSKDVKSMENKEADLKVRRNEHKTVTLENNKNESGDLIIELLKRRKQAEETRRKVLSSEFGIGQYYEEKKNKEYIVEQRTKKENEMEKSAELEPTETEVKAGQEQDDREETNLFSYSKENFSYFTDIPKKSELRLEKVDICTLGEFVIRSALAPVNSGLKVVSQACLRMEEEALMKYLERLRKYFLDGTWRISLSAQNLKIDQPLPDSLIEVLYKDVTWPLNIILTQETLAKYETLFSFFVTVERAVWALQQALLFLKIKSVPVKGFQYRQIHLYRHIMAHYVGSLQTYLVNSVLEECWQNFKKSLSKVKDIDDLYREHVSYLKGILLKCLLNKRSEKLKRELLRLIETVFCFCELLHCGGEWSIDKDNKFTHSRFRRLRHTFRTFLQLGSYITKYIARLVQMGYQSQDLEVLHKLLTLNSFYVGSEDL